ncbi:MAG: isoaspartyl peptidase/L-asparaginase [Gemmatimonadota bacterium]|nr:isoaspartyl peptidase/L-asparaginase [Gemmatimonadota bacterium]
MTMTSEIRVESGLAIHGGVGTISADRMSADLKAAYEEALAASLLAGHEVLRGGGSATDGVVAAVSEMEDSPLFNAGRGSNLDERGIVTMDASLMRGEDRAAGAVAGVETLRNPIRAAGLVLERSEHVLLIAEGAEAFCRDEGLATEPAGYFVTERRLADLERARKRNNERPDVLGDAAHDSTPEHPSSRAGTVGAVARDSTGSLAAGTSTGGMANKRWGRVGDSPLVGAGTYASPLCAVSCTGWGERFIEHAVAYQIHARMDLAGVSLAEAVRAVLWDELAARVPRSGGLVAMDAQGHVELAFNTPGMYRGWIGEDGRPHVDIYGGRA